MIANGQMRKICNFKWHVASLRRGIILFGDDQCRIYLTIEESQYAKVNDDIPLASFSHLCGLNLYRKISFSD